MMKALALFLFVVVMATAEDTELSADSLQLASDNTDFAFRLHRLVAKDNQNTFMAPLSISIALAMTYLGAAGDTETEMARVLFGANIEDRDIPFDMNALLDIIFDDDKNYTLRSANRLYGEKTYEFSKTFLDDIEDYYEEEGLEKIDFLHKAEHARSKINKWVKDETENKIKDLLPEGSVTSATRLVIVNAIYFKALWASPFDAEKTSKEDFSVSSDNRVRADFMKSNVKMYAGSGDAFQIAEIPYAGNDVSMLVILPDEGSSLSQIEKNLTSASLNRAIKNMKLYKVDFKMPKFKITHHQSLKETLIEMGMERVFDIGSADLSGMDGTRNLFVSDVIHQAFVEVDEKGTEAAGATGVLVAFKSMISSKTLHLDRPFLFLIQEKSTKSVLFLGRVVNPTTTFMPRRSAMGGEDGGTSAAQGRVPSCFWMVYTLLASLFMKAACTYTPAF